MISFEHLKVAVLGLAFKPGTDDLREAPSIDNIALLLKNGADIVAYDPVAMNNFKKKFPEGAVERGTISYTEQMEAALKDANICFIFTEWKEIQKVEPETFKRLMRTPLVYDGRNIFDPEKMKAAGVEYYSIGR